MRYTQGKDGSVYAIYLIDEAEKEIPAELVITGIHPVKNATLSILGIERSNLKWKNEGDSCIIQFPLTIKKKIPSRYAFVIKISTV